MRKTYKLLKDMPTLRKGALFQEECDDGTQPYKLITPEFNKYDSSRNPRFTARAAVEDQPKWFVEVFQVEPQFMTRDELDQWEAFKKVGVRAVRVKSESMKPKRKYVRSDKYSKKAA